MPHITSVLGMVLRALSDDSAQLRKAAILAMIAVCPWLVDEAAVKAFQASMPQLLQVTTDPTRICRDLAACCGTLASQLQAAADHGSMLLLLWWTSPTGTHQTALHWLHAVHLETDRLQALTASANTAAQPCMRSLTSHCYQSLQHVASTQAVLLLGR